MSAKTRTQSSMCSICICGEVPIDEDISLQTNNKISRGFKRSLRMIKPTQKLSIKQQLQKNQKEVRPAKFKIRQQGACKIQQFCTLPKTMQSESQKTVGKQFIYLSSQISPTWIFRKEEPILKLSRLCKPKITFKMEAAILPTQQNQKQIKQKIDNLISEKISQAQTPRIQITDIKTTQQRKKQQEDISSIKRANLQLQKPQKLKIPLLVKVRSLDPKLIESEILGESDAISEIDANFSPIYQNPESPNSPTRHDLFNQGLFKNFLSEI